MSDKNEESKPIESSSETKPPETVVTPPTQETKPEVKPEAKVEEKKPDEKKADAPAPLTAESIKLPEGVQVNEPLMQEFLGVMNNAELDPVGRAQALIDLQVKAMNEVQEAGNKLWEDMQETWTKEAKEDPVIGPKLDEHLGNISKLVDKYMVDKEGKPDAKAAAELRGVFDLTGAGNNPHVIKFLSKIASELVKEGGPIIPNSPAKLTGDPAAILYPNQGKA